jgi:hypothetical protein
MCVKETEATRRIEDKSDPPFGLDLVQFWLSQFLLG